MATMTEIPPILIASQTMADIVSQLGDIPLERILIQPPLGAATEADQIAAAAQTGKLCELVAGILVEKPMGAYESMLAAEMIHLLLTFLDSNCIGFVYGESGSARMANRNVRMPDVSFFRSDRFPDGKPPNLAVNACVPDLAIEILSPTNTKKEMAQKLAEYFAAGVKLVWYIDPPTRTAKLYTAIDQLTEITADGYLLGGEILPGLQIQLGKIFSRVDGR